MKVSGEMHKGAFIGFFQGISGIIFLKPSDTLYETFQGFDSSHFILRSLKCIQIQWLPKMFVHFMILSKIDLYSLIKRVIPSQINTVILGHHLRF